MKIIGIVPNRVKDPGLKFTRILVKTILEKGGVVKLEDEVAKELDLQQAGLSEDGVLSCAQIIICLGGDGTFLKLARKAYNKDIALLGINLGSLGFLTEVEKSEIESSVCKLLEGSFEIEERIMLEAAIVSSGVVIAREAVLNDVVVSRVALSRILHLKTYIDDIFVDSFPGDGLIVSTPTGSTAYSLSAGGPIVEPHVDLMILTPICPHILYSRSFIVAGDRVVRVDVDENYCHNAMVTLDGQIGYEIRGGDSIEIKKSANAVKIIRLNSRNFFNVLRTKIYDRGERIQNEI